MASSCGPFHEEALRRQRVIDKKRAALQRLEARKEDDDRNAAEKARLDAEMKQKRHDDKMKELQEHLNSFKDERGTKKTVNGIPKEIYQQMKVKEKQLRNSNLVIGHPKALWDAR